METTHNFDHYAVMGYPISHSRSPGIHHLFAEQSKQHIVYSAILVEPGDFSNAVAAFQSQGGKGLNVTIPYKEEAWSLVNQRSARAEKAGAVNTIMLRQDGSLYGDNTDGIGLVNDLTKNQSLSLKNKKILILGAGGAVKGILQPILIESPAQIVIANRTPDKALTLAKQYAEIDDTCPVIGVGFDEIPKQLFDIVINGTASSLTGNIPDIKAELVNNAFCYDMMYGKEATTFMQWCMKHNASNVSDGLGMLIEQAAAAFYVWRNVQPDTRPVITRIRSTI